MRALKSEDLIAIMDFLYFGEANIFQENLDSFLVLAEDLQLKGLTTGTDEIGKDQGIKTSPKYQEFPVKKENTPKSKNTTFSPRDEPSSNSDRRIAAMNTNPTISANLEDLDGQIWMARSNQ